jgi:nucleotide-binding universal stress UspA family protein
MLTIRSILYPTDFSSFSTHAYFHAVTMAEACRANLTVVYVYSPSGKTAPAVERAYWREQLETLRPSNSNIPVTHVLLEGKPSEEIVQYAAESGSDMIVLGTHGRSGVEHDLMGSTAARVMQDAPCPVMVVKLPTGTRPVSRPQVELVAQA